MSQIIEAIDWFHEIMENKSDPRVNNWPLMSGPCPTIFLSIFYAIFVIKIGPNLMKDRKPFEFNNILIIYNAIQVYISAWLFYQASIRGWATFYNLRCQPIDYSNNHMAVMMAELCWWYFMSKFVEFFDTIFFVLRKKHKNISTLHVIHHGIMPISSWFGVKFFAGGHPTFFGLVNAFVHIIMYTYYMLAAMGPRIQPYLWWKKYLTLLQIVQFIVVIIHSIQPFFIKCDLSTGLFYIIIAHGFMFLGLFIHFYYQAYLIKRAQKVQENVQKSNGFKNNLNGIYSTIQEGPRKRILS